MTSYTDWLKKTFGYTHDWQLVVTEDIQGELGVADESKIKQLESVLCNKRDIVAVYGRSNVMMMEIVIDQGSLAVFSYLKSLGATAINQALRNAAKVLKERL